MGRVYLRFTTPMLKPRARAQMTLPPTPPTLLNVWGPIQNVWGLIHFVWISPYMHGARSIVLRAFSHFHAIYRCFPRVHIYTRVTARVRFVHNAVSVRLIPFDIACFTYLHRVMCVYVLLLIRVRPGPDDRQPQRWCSKLPVQQRYTSLLISFRDSTDLISHFPVQFPLTATRSSHFPFAVRLDRSHFATRPISFPISHFSAISIGRDSIRSSISFPNP